MEGWPFGSSQCLCIHKTDHSENVDGLEREVRQTL